MMLPPQIFDQPVLRARRQRFADRLPQHDFLMAQVAADFADRLASIRRHFAVALDLSAGSGRIGAALLNTGKIGRLISADTSLALAQRLPAPVVAADAALLPFATASLDCVAAAGSLHLVDDLPGTLAQIRRCLRPDGLFLGALLAGDTLGELRLAFATAEAEISGGASPRVAPFAHLRELGGLLQRAGFALPVADSESLTVTYPDVWAVMRELRYQGAANPLLARARQPLRRDVLMRAADIYTRQFASGETRVRATFEIVTLTGWAPHESQQQPLRPGSAKASLADALRRT